MAAPLPVASRAWNRVWAWAWAWWPRAAPPPSCHSPGDEACITELELATRVLRPAWWWCSWAVGCWLVPAPAELFDRRERACWRSGAPFGLETAAEASTPEWKQVKRAGCTLLGMFSDNQNPQARWKCIFIRYSKCRICYCNCCSSWVFIWKQQFLTVVVTVWDRVLCEIQLIL